MISGMHTKHKMIGENKRKMLQSQKTAGYREQKMLSKKLTVGRWGENIRYMIIRKRGSTMNDQQYTGSDVFFSRNGCDVHETCVKWIALFFDFQIGAVVRMVFMNFFRGR